MKSHEECLRIADNTPRGASAVEAGRGCPYEGLRLDQTWQSWLYCSRSTEGEVRMALNSARLALSDPGNQFGTYPVQLKAMIAVYEECLG